MKINDDEMLEFKTEAFELIDHAEKSLLALEEGAEFSAEYNSIFRAFHCIKGSAGMLDLVPLQTHMHHLETALNQYKDSGNMPKEVIDRLLKRYVSGVFAVLLLKSELKYSQTLLSM